ncbi:MAG: hypothetical protein RL711_1245 [Bacteroidota bacterium]|jgi:hypothetical protein
MNNRAIISTIASIIWLVFLQTVLVRNFVLFDLSFCYVYVAVLIFLPLDMKAIPLMLVGFFLGLLVDAFYDSIGIHTAACVLMGMVRSYVIKFVTPIGGYENIVSFRQLSIRWIASYAFLLIFIHHLALFYLEAGGFHMFFTTLAKIFLSSIFTLITVVLYRLIFFSPYSRE